MIELLTIVLFIFVCLRGIMNPIWALVLVISMFGFEQALQASSSIFISNPALVNQITGLICLISATSLIVRDRTILNGAISTTYICTIIIYAWSALSVAWSPAYDVAQEIILKGIPYFILFIIISPILIDEIDSLGTFFMVFFYIATLICILLILNPQLTFYRNRISLDLGASGHSNVLALGGIGGEIIILAALIRTGHSLWLLNITRVLALVSGALLALQSGSRGQLLSSIILSIIFYPISKQIKNVKSFGGTIAGFIVFIPIIYLIATKFLSVDSLSRWDSNNLDEGVSARLFNIFDLLNAWIKSPLSWVFGLGFNAFSSVTPAGAREGYSHNMTVDILTESGLLIFVVYIILLYKCFTCSVWLFKKYQDFPKQRTIVSVLIAMTLYNFLIVNKQGNLWGNQLFFLYAILLFRLRNRTSYYKDELDENLL